MTSFRKEAITNCLKFMTYHYSIGSMIEYSLLKQHLRELVRLETQRGENES